MDSIAQKKVQRYKNGISAIIIFAVLSVINVFAYAYTETYFLFSSYVSLVATSVLLELGAGSVAIIVSLILVAPYVVFAILARKRPWAMIVSLVLVSVDTLFLLLDVLLTGDVAVIASFIVDIICHALVIVELLIAVINKDAVKLMAEEKLRGESLPDQVKTEVLPDGQVVTVLEDTDVFSDVQNDSALANVKRKITITRNKAYVNGGLKFGVVMDGVEVVQLKNGETANIMVSGSAHAFCIQLQNYNSNYLQIPAGTEDRAYVVTHITKWFSPCEIRIDEADND